MSSLVLENGHCLNGKDVVKTVYPVAIITQIISCSIYNLNSIALRSLRKLLLIAFIRYGTCPRREVKY